MLRIKKSWGPHMWERPKIPGALVEESSLASGQLECIEEKIAHLKTLMMWFIDNLEDSKLEDLCRHMGYEILEESYGKEHPVGPKSLVLDSRPKAQQPIDIREDLITWGGEGQLIDRKQFLRGIAARVYIKGVGYFLPAIITDEGTVKFKDGIAWHVGDDLPSWATYVIWRNE